MPVTNGQKGLQGKFNGVHANGEIPAAYAGGYVYIDSTATSVSLPKASTVPANSVYFLQNTTPGYNVTVSCFAGDSIWDDASKTTFVLPYLAQVCLMQTPTGWQMMMRQKTPNYGIGSACAWNATIQAPVDGFVSVGAWGPFRNGYKVSVGDTSAVPTIIAYEGDDMNNNTKGGSFSFPVKAGSWFRVDPWLTDAYENMAITFWANT